MNPETGKFEPLTFDDDDIAKAQAGGEALNAQYKALLTKATLVRPNVEPVPAHWKVFTVGELVEVKGATMKVAHIGESHCLLEPVSQVVGEG